jgi:hypothetical protein
VIVEGGGVDAVSDFIFDAASDRGSLDGFGGVGISLRR